MHISQLAVLATSIGLISQTPAQAQVSISNKTLPLNTAIIAAQTAVNTCKANGFDVTATVVDVSGTPQVVLRGDHAVIHTKDSSFRKAYTVVTMGPIFHVDTTSPRSLVLNQCTIVFPHGGQPIPCTQPFTVWSTMSSASDP